MIGKVVRGKEAMKEKYVHLGTETKNKIKAGVTVTNTCQGGIDG